MSIGRNPHFKNDVKTMVSAVAGQFSVLSYSTARGDEVDRSIDELMDWLIGLLNSAIVFVSHRFIF